jgi:hypothetical protein
MRVEANSVLATAETRPDACEADGGPDASSGARFGLAAAAGFGFTLLIAVVTALIVREYYHTHQPHYDSIASYARAFNIVNLAQRDGLGAAWAIASKTSVTWLQPLYTLCISWLPARAPEWLVPLNFVLMALSQLTILVWCRDQGYGTLQTIVLLVLPYLPGELNVWDGGLQDWRRDSQLNALLIGDLFLSLAYVLRPTIWKGLGLGVMLGLTQWSRDNAFSMIFWVMIPAVFVAIRQTVRRRRWLDLLLVGWLPVLVFLAMALPYYGYTIDSTISRYLYGVWGPGEDRWASLLHWWRSPWDVLLGGTGQYNGKDASAYATLALLAGILVLLVAAVLVRVLAFRPHGLLAPRARLLLLSGAFIVGSVVLYNTVILGYGAQYHGIPFMPVLVGIVAIAAGLSDAFTVRPEWQGRVCPRALLSIGLVVLFSTVLFRTCANQYEYVGPEAVEATRDATRRISQLAAGRPVALLSLYELGPAQMQYYGSQQNLPEFAGIGGLATVRPAPPSEDAALIADFEQTLRTQAAFVVLATDTKRYTNPAYGFPMYRSGTALADKLMNDRDFEKVDEFVVARVPFTVLANRKLR